MFIDTVAVELPQQEPKVGKRMQDHQEENHGQIEGWQTWHIEPNPGARLAIKTSITELTNLTTFLWKDTVMYLKSEMLKCFVGKM